MGKDKYKSVLEMKREMYDFFWETFPEEESIIKFDKDVDKEFIRFKNETIKEEFKTVPSKRIVDLG